MMRRLDATAPGFSEAFDRLLGQSREAAEDVRGAVAAIIAEIRAEGDTALLALTQRFDRYAPGLAALCISAAEIDAACRAVPAATLDALDLAARRIAAYHETQRPADVRFTDEAGVSLGFRWRPVAAAGLYVPGGTAAYPSSVLMNAIPAKVAGVGRLVMTVPAPDGVLNPLVLAAASRAGVSEIYRVGGAQAIAALAYGTATIAPVDVIVGPGNAYVAEAKRQVFGQVGIDMIAGPSEILVLADGANDPAWVAADLLSQAEHGTDSQSILITDDANFASAVAAAVEEQLATLPRAKIARASWEDYGAIILVRTLDEAIALIDRIAPEHVEILSKDAEALASRIRNAGAIFLDAFTPEPIGDYVAGTNHVLPTGRSARFASGLSVFDFLKRTSLVKAGRSGLQAIGPAAVELARAEGLEAHARAVAFRLDKTSR
jgi:histidinol dehydrogenase